ncbi:hypothetical protein [Phyllobacterium leguminum]|uniref:Uncharacterized protein n=1 Tax=Phyllobacterium leguminum TaxID=314237 RepID=A0A318SV01_9HYPH|nr:hypothetical protein [Phyllobacterium leguminum]PYE85225.1 hypothetical protein C7477_1354 [Phyllobacterium leguminum]
MSQDEVVTIDLDLIGNPNPTAQNFIQREARTRVIRALSRPVKPPADENEKDDRPAALNVLQERRHDAILVSARRGEGKTTFLASILKSIETNEYRDEFAKENAGKTTAQTKLYSLGIIDPTLIETKQNIIIAVIDRIRIATEHRRTRSGRFDEHKQVEDALRRLAQGLSLLDGIGEGLYAGKDWLDPDYVLDRGLEDASAAHDFERRFRAYVKAAAKYMDTDAFVLAIDDVDTWFERGWPVLEALRKYFVTPQLRIILSGDLSLYALLVRRQQWGQMGQDFLKAEKLRDDADRQRDDADSHPSLIGKINSMVDALQDQYLVKVAPPENRADLMPLAYHAKIRTFEVKATALPVPMSLDDFIHRLVDRVFGNRYEPDVQLIRRQLLQIPTRSALQVLAGAVAVCATDDPKADSERRAAQDALMHIAWTALMSLGLEVEKTRDAAPDAIFGVLGEWLTRSALWPTLGRFHPDAVDADDSNLVALYVTAVLNGVFRASPGKLIDYWLRIAIVREKVDRGEIASSSISRLFSHLSAGTVESSLQFVSRLASWEAIEGREGNRRNDADIRLSGASVPLQRVREAPAAARELYGLEYAGKLKLNREAFLNLAPSPAPRTDQILTALPPPLRGYHKALLNAGWSYASRRRKEAGFQVYFVNAAEDLSDRLDRNSRLVARIPLNRIVSGQAAEAGSYSFPRILAVIGELIDLLSNEKRQVGIKAVLRASSQARSYPTPAATRAGLAGVDDDLDDDDYLAADRDPSASDDNWSIEDVLNSWLSDHAKRGPLRPLAPIVLSRMWTRFTYTFHNVRENLRHGETRYLGVLMHRSVIAFLHSVGYEAMRAANVGVSDSLSNNPVNSGEITVGLLNEIYNNPENEHFRKTPEFAFFDLIFTCPLWGYFLARDERDEVAAPRRGDPNNQIVKTYQEKTSSYWSEAKAPFALIELYSPRKEAEAAATFDGLFFPLNTVQLQGQFTQNRRFGPVLSKALARATTQKGGQATDAATGTSNEIDILNELDNL